jgi:hypothetical protein
VTASENRFVGLQMSPVNFLDEGVEPLLDMLTGRYSINAVLVGTVSWLGLKVGRRVSQSVEGWPDHGAQDPTPLRGGSYLTPRSDQYERTALKHFRAPDEAFADIDILDHILDAATERGIRVYSDLMEPMLHYAGHGSANTIDVPGIAQVMQVDVLGRMTSEPCLNHPDWRNWLYSVIEDHARNYGSLAGIMWCNERRSPLDSAVTAVAPHCFCDHCRRLAVLDGVDVEAARVGLERIWRLMEEIRGGDPPQDGALVGFLRTIYEHPEVFKWEKFWVERNKALDRELYGIAKFVKPDLEYGLNVWNRNHFNPWRKAQWPWREQAQWADWVKPIVYQHQSGGVLFNEWAPLLAGIFSGLEPDAVMEVVKAVLGLQKEAHYADLVTTGLDPDSYVYGQCAETVAALEDKIPVYMGIGVDAPRSRTDQAECTPDIVRRSVLATFRAGGKGVIFGPAYSGMNLTTLDGATEAFAELDRAG